MVNGPVHVACQSLQPVSCVRGLEKARGTLTDRKPTLQAEQQRDVNSSGHTVIDGRQNKHGARHCRFGQWRWDERCPEKELPFSCFSSLNEGWRTAKPGSEHVVYSINLDQHTLSALATASLAKRLRRPRGLEFKPRF